MRVFSAVTNATGAAPGTSFTSVRPVGTVMADHDSTAESDTDAARMELTPDGLHESAEGYALDCPECGSTVSVHRIVETGRCSGTLDADHTETTGEDRQIRDPECTAELSLELVWTA